jgi:hypothetical protein
VNPRAVIAVALSWVAMLGVFVWAVTNTHGDANSAMTQAQIATEIATKLRAAQIKSCHEVGDPLRRGEIKLWQDKIHDTQTVHPQDFPAFSKRRFHRLIRKKRHVAHQHIHTLRHSPPCERRF